MGPARFHCANLLLTKRQLSHPTNNACSNQVIVDYNNIVLKFITCGTQVLKQRFQNQLYDFDPPPPRKSFGSFLSSLFYLRNSQKLTGVCSPQTQIFFFKFFFSKTAFLPEHLFFQLHSVFSPHF